MPQYHGDSSLKSRLLGNVGDRSDEENSVGSDGDDSDASSSTPLPTVASPTLQSDVSSSLNAPRDSYHMAYIIFFIQGVGMLLPWNFFITANDYFQYKFGSVESIKEKFEEAFSLAAMVPNVLSLLLNIYLTSRLSRNSRIFPCLVMVAVLFSITAAFVKVDTASWTKDFFIVTVVSVVLINTASGIYQGAMFGTAGIVGPKYTQGIMMGQGVAGVFAAVASILTKAGDGNIRDSAFAYFLTAVVVILICGIAFSALFKLQIMQYYCRRLQRKVGQAARQKKLGGSTELLKAERGTSPPYWLIVKQIAPLAFSVLFCFTVTLALFPSILSNIHSVNESNGSPWTNKFFAPMVCFLLFNAGDFTGRLIAGSFQIVKERGCALPLLVLARVVFIPLFMLCNYQPRKHGKLVFDSDYAPVIINFFFSISNGYLGSLCMMYGPKLVAPEHAEVAGTIMAFFLTAGLCLGAAFSFALAGML